MAKFEVKGRNVYEGEYNGNSYKTVTLYGMHPEHEVLKQWGTLKVSASALERAGFNEYDIIGCTIDYEYNRYGKVGSITRTDAE